jgi:hypothetical protein
MRRGKLESHRSPDVVDDQVESVELQRVGGSGREASEPGPAVVVVLGAFGEPEPGEVPCDSTQPPRGELVDDLAVEERRASHPVAAENRVACALFADEAADPSGCERAPCASVGVDDLSSRHGLVLLSCRGGELIVRA